MQVGTYVMKLSRADEILCASNYVFGAEAPSDQTLDLLPYRQVSLRYLTVTAMSGASARFQDPYFPRAKFGPIVLPFAFWGLVRRGDTFLACVGLEGERWELIYLSGLIEKLPG